MWPVGRQPTNSTGLTLALTLPPHTKVASGRCGEVARLRRGAGSRTASAVPARVGSRYGEAVLPCACATVLRLSAGALRLLQTHAGLDAVRASPAGSLLLPSWECVQATLVVESPPLLTVRAHALIRLRAG
jgi:hypothetical protein